MSIIKRRFLGFTLIELLVVISIIGLLAAFSMVSFSTSQKQARDAERQSDLKQYQATLVSFAGKNKGLYPQRANDIEADTELCGDLGLTSVGCPSDPKDPAYTYQYCTNGTVEDGTAGATAFALWAEYEGIEDNYFVICSSGKAGDTATAPTCGGTFSCLP